MINSIGKTIGIILKVALLLALVFVALFIYNKASVKNTDNVLRIATQFAALEQKDEYIIAEFKNHEILTREQYNLFFDYPLGDTTATINLDAIYKYYVKLAELSVNINNETIFIEVPKLYLSLPVAFELSSVSEESKKFMFGPNEKELLKKLKQNVSAELAQKGNAQVGVVYDKAAKSLADNYNSFLIANGYGDYYKNIVVTFANENSKLQRQFHYNDSLCGDKKCLLELNINKGLFFTIR